MKIYTEEMEKFIRLNAPGKFNKELTKLFNKVFNVNFSLESIRCKKKHMRVKSGVDTGKLLADVGKKTRFKKGNVPYQFQPIGTEVLRCDGYIWVKVKITKPARFGWVQKHRLIYEENYGSIPEGYQVMFKDQDKLNLDPNNLMLVTMNQKAYVSRNRLFTSDPELNAAAFLVSSIASKAKKLGERL